MSEYSYEEVEARWKEYWADKNTYEVNNNESNPKYVLEMFPYPSGNIHMGHVRNYTIGDAIARYFRKGGYEVLHPMGWDAFGLPAENAAIERDIHPRDWTHENISDMRDELKRLGFSYDWSREIKTCDSQYYRWNQEIFLELFERGLAYRDVTEVNWCPSCETVLANEQVQDDLCWRCDTPIEEKRQPGWFLKITEYAQELLDDMQQLDGWPDKVLDQQINWIGRSTGARINFEIDESSQQIEVFTTRPDTVYGATYMALSPQHPRVSELVEGTPRESEVLEFVDRVTESDETETTEGVFTGKYAVNPINDEKLPIYVADYVLMEYGTGAIMAVPAHDQRDFEFAKHHDIEIKQVIEPENDSLSSPLDEAYESDGVLINSGKHSGLSSSDARSEIAQWLDQHGAGDATVQYRLRDWGISRQRYWGTPIPIILCDDCGPVPVPETDRPVELPQDVEFTHSGNILSESEDFGDVDCPECGGKARRETDTMDTFVDSSWYYTRYLSPTHTDAPFDAEVADRWLPVDHYIGGIEHACMHLLYARFIHKALRDVGWLESDEPFKNLLTQGMVLKDGTKMSKSLGNVVDPGEMIDKYGADTVRMFTLFAAPPEKDLEWDESGVQGSFRFLNRIWSYMEQHKDSLMNSGLDEPETEVISDTNEDEIHRKTHRTIKQVTSDIDNDFQFNTAIAACMELFNELQDTDPSTNNISAWSFQVLLDLLAPITPHFCNEVADRLGFDSLPVDRGWPDWSADAVEADEIEIAIQVNGSVRDHMTVPVDCDEEQLKTDATDREKIQNWLNGDEPKKIIVVPNKLVNIVV